MPIDPEKLLSLEIADETRAPRDQDFILYALAVGLGRDPSELPFVYEKDLRAVPTIATVLAYNDGWLARGGVPLPQVFHAAQRLVFHAPIPFSGRCTARNRIAGLADKGEGKAVLILQEAELVAEGSEAPFATGLSTLFVRGGGGFGGSRGMPLPEPKPAPERAPDRVLAVQTRSDQALIFRLLGDRNPLHADPEAAQAAGFDRPILHGACTFGIACATLLREVCGMRPGRLASIEARFATPVFPGEELAMALWQEGGEVRFQLRSPEREAVILDAGHARLRAADSGGSQEQG